MASLGHTVVGIDVDHTQIAKLAAGDPLHEPGLTKVLKDGLTSGRLTFSTDYADLADAGVHFIAVDTPQRHGAQGADMAYVDAATEAISTDATSSAPPPGKKPAGHTAGWDAEAGPGPNRTIPTSGTSRQPRTA